MYEMCAYRYSLKMRWLHQYTLHRQRRRREVLITHYLRKAHADNPLASKQATTKMTRGLMGRERGKSEFYTTGRSFYIPWCVVSAFYMYTRQYAYIYVKKVHRAVLQRVCWSNRYLYTSCCYCVDVHEKKIMVMLFFSIKIDLTMYTLLFTISVLSIKNDNKNSFYTVFLFYHRREYNR